MASKVPSSIGAYIYDSYNQTDAKKPGVVKPGSSPPVIGDPIGSKLPVGVFGRTEDPAKFFIQKNRFERPMLAVPGGDFFAWPVGIEGVRVTGNATLVEHKYIGDNDVVVQVLHLDERRLEMSGMFPGMSGANNMFDLLQIIRTPARFKSLSLPGVFQQIQKVVVDNYTFDHPEDDRNDSWTYQISFRRTGVGKKIKRPKKIAPPGNPRSGKAKAKSTKVFTVRAGYRTLKAISKKVYGDPKRWRDLYNANEAKFQLLMKSQKFNMHQLPIKRLPLGIKIHY